MHIMTKVIRTEIHLGIVCTHFFSKIPISTIAHVRQGQKVCILLWKMYLYSAFTSYGLVL